MPTRVHFFSSIHCRRVASLRRRGWSGGLPVGPKAATCDMNARGKKELRVVGLGCRAARYSQRQVVAGSIGVGIVANSIPCVVLLYLYYKNLPKSYSNFSGP